MPRCLRLLDDFILRSFCSVNEMAFDQTSYNFALQNDQKGIPGADKLGKFQRLLTRDLSPYLSAPRLRGGVE